MKSWDLHESLFLVQPYVGEACRIEIEGLIASSPSNMDEEGVSKRKESAYILARIIGKRWETIHFSRGLWSLSDIFLRFRLMRQPILLPLLLLISHWRSVGLIVWTTLTTLITMESRGVMLEQVSASALVS